MSKDLIKIYHKQPKEELSKFIRKISILESEGEINYSQKLTPSPYNYLSYNHKDIPTSIFEKERIKPNHRLMISGIKTEEIYVKYEGYLSQLLIEFSASGFYYLFHLSPVGYRNKFQPLGNVISTKSESNLLYLLKDSDGPEEQISIIEKSLRIKSYKALDSIKYLEKAISLIEENHGSLHIKEVANKAGVSERQLNRKFTEVVGIAPKKFSKILQLHYIIYLIQQNKFDMEDIVYKSYLFDRAHLVHTFKELTGMTPKEFICSKKHVAFKYFNSF